jgi:FkbM family methyltransferase
VFSIVNTDHGAMLVNRLDFQVVKGGAVGVGFQLLEYGEYDSDEIIKAIRLLKWQFDRHGPGVVAIDGGANIGVHTVEWAKYLRGWGRVIAFEPQEIIYYALAGNIVIANAFNVTAHHAALDSVAGQMDMPVPNYMAPGNFGGLQLKIAGQDIGQDCTETTPVRVMTVDGLGLDRLDLLKLDVEGMELGALAGASETIGRCRPVILAEAIRCGRAELRGFLESRDYRCWDVGLNILATHRSAPELPDGIVQ